MKTKVLLLICLLVLSISPVIAQPISESDVPQDVFISFKYKYPDATIQSWETSKGNFLAKFKLSDQDGSAEFTANGKWLISRFIIIEKELPSPIYTYFKDNYKSKDYVISISELIKDGNGETYYYLQAKKSGINQPKPVELFFDLTGNLTKKIDPDDVGINADVNEVHNDVHNDVKIDTAVADNSNFNKKELPTSANNYIKANYPDHYIKESNFIKDSVLGETYYLILKQQGFKDQIELYFDINGALLKKIDSREIKANQAQNNQQTNNQQTQNNQVSNNQNAEVVKKKTEGDPIADNKVPEVAKTHFISKNKKVANVSWFKVERNFVARFDILGKKGQSVYNEDGGWIETRIDQDFTTLSALIQSYVKDNFRKFRVEKAVFVQAAPKTKFYEIQLAEKSNKDSNPHITKAFFDGNGKFTNIEKPDEDDPNAVNEQQQKDEQDKEFLDNVDASNQTIDKGTGVNDKISPKELPTEAINYIKTNFKEEVIKECRYLFDDDLNANIYYVTVKKEGDKYEVELYFDLTGKLLKKIDPTDQKYQNESGDNNNVKLDEYNAGSSESVDPKELPSGIKNYLKDNYPEYKVDEAKYMTDEEFGNVYYLVLKKSGNKTLIHLWFDLNGKLVKSEQVSE
jgi:hypothetical protein